MREDLKPILEGIAAELIENEIDLERTPALFSWWYPDNDMIQYQLMIRVFPKEHTIYMEADTNVH